MSLVAGDGIVISGSRDTTIKVWDMQSFACKRTLRGHKDDVLSLALGADLLFSGSADGHIIVWRLDTLQSYKAFKEADKGIQALVAAPFGMVFSGLNGGVVLAYDMPEVPKSPNGRRRCKKMEELTPAEAGVNANFEYDVPTLSAQNSMSSMSLSSYEEHLSIDQTLSELISYESVSTDDSCFHKEECWGCAKYLTSLLERLGATVKMVSLVEGRSPLVFGRFGTDPHKPTVTFYGHYDVVAATEKGWKSPPFEMTAVNGYLYGRGVTDNKVGLHSTVF